MRAPQTKQGSGVQTAITKTLFHSQNILAGSMPCSASSYVNNKTNTFPGISGKSQALFALVFCTRYLDLFFSFVSIYNTSMKVIYICCSVGEYTV